MAGGIAVDEKDDLWVANRENSLAEFSPAYEGENKFIEALPNVTGPDRLEHLAIEFPSEHFFVVGAARGNSGSGVDVYDRAGNPVREWGQLTRASIAIDNAPNGSLEDPSACGSLPLSPGECFVYVTEQGEDGGISRFNTKGEPEPFSFAKTCPEKPECYVSGNEIRGVPGRPKGIFGLAGLVGVAIDAKGDIYAANGEMHTIDEYQPSGAFVRGFELGSEAPPFGHAGVGQIQGVAIDAASGHVLVPVTAPTPEGAFGAIDEFDTETGKYVAQVTGAPGGGRLHRPGPLAVDTRGDLYVVDRTEVGSGEEPVYVYERGHFDPSVTVGAVGARRPTSATLSGAVNPEGFALTECEFQYVQAEKFEKEGFAHPSVAECQPRAGEIPQDSQSHAVVAAVSGLEPGVGYRYRLLAHSAGELGGTGVTGTRAFTTPAPPVVGSVSASHISSAFADLGAVIEPRGAPATYHFEYLTAAAYREDGESFTGPQAPTSAPVPDGAIGSGGATGSDPESVVVHVGGLAPGSEYRFRVVAGSECEALDHPGHQCASVGSTAVFTTLPGPHTGLPDNRAYELVTPADKEGGSDMFAEEETNGEFLNAHSTGTPSRDGNGFLLSTFSPFGAFPSAGESAYVFRRDVPGQRWTNVSLASPKLGVQAIVSANGLVFDPVDLSRVGFQDGVGSVLSEEGVYHVDLLGPPGAPGAPCKGAPGIERAVSEGCYVPLREDPHFHVGEKPVETFVVGASRDLGHVVLDSNAKGACAPVAAAMKVTTGDVLCEWDGGIETLEGGEMRPALKLVNLAPGSETEPTSPCGAQLGGISGSGSGSGFRAVSVDGARVFFTSPQKTGHEGGVTTGKGCWNGATQHAPQLYMRTGGQTVEISAPEAGVSDPTGQHVAEYAGASEDGSKVFFQTSTELTAQTQALGLHDRELYEYDVETGTLKWISGGETGKAAADLYAVTAVAADGSAVYFLANGIVAANAGANGTHATPGDCGVDPSRPGVGGSCALYRYDTATGAASYIATVNDLAFGEHEDHTPHAGSDSDWYTTPDGRYLLFKSNLPLTSFSNAGSVCTILVGGGDNHGPCSELYRYSQPAAEHGEQAVVCVSCGTEGTLPTGNAEFDRSGTQGPAERPVVGMSDNGAYVFFDTPTRLVPQAENHTLAVYEWHEGDISLLSSPNDPFPSYFLGYSPYYTPGGTKVEGGNVFIGTHAQLIPHESNAVGNIYDVRICLAQSPCISPPSPPPTQCEGGACQTPPVGSPARTPGSMTFTGPGNPPPPTPPSPPGHRGLTNAQKLAKALKACRRDRSKHRRVACERRARKTYAPAKGGHR
jgi:hypothetical protein